MEAMLPATKLKRIVQLLGMTSSTYDGEALNAIRLCNKILHENRLNWAALWAGVTNSSSKDILRSEREGARRQGWEEGFAAGFAKGRAAVKPDRVRPQPRGDPDWRLWAREAVIAYGNSLTDWEQAFFHGFATGRYRTPTPRQRTVFASTAKRLHLDLPGG